MVYKWIVLFEVCVDMRENAGTQNEGSRDTKANVEAVDKTRIEHKRETETKGEKEELRVRPCA